MLVLLEADGVEDEELQLRAEIRGVRDTAAAKVLLGLLGYVSRVLLVPVPVNRFTNIAEDRKRRYLACRVQESSVHVGDKEHVALIDVGEPPYGRCIETHTVL